jgi:hypothetical protein
MAMQAAGERDVTRLIDAGGGVGGVYDVQDFVDVHEGTLQDHVDGRAMELQDEKVVCGL